MGKMPRIRCAKCDKLVDEVFIFDDPFRRVKVITAICHGKSDMMEISDKVLAWLSVPEMAALEHSEGIAFQEEKLGEVKKLNG